MTGMRLLAVERIARIQMVIETAGRLLCATRPGRTPLQLVPGCNGKPHSLKPGAGLEKSSVQQQLMRRENVDPPARPFHRVVSAPNPSTPPQLAGPSDYSPPPDVSCPLSHEDEASTEFPINL